MYYAIKELGTTNFLTNTRNRNKTSAELCSTKPPRLFTTKGGATRAMKKWQEGEMFVKSYRGTYHEQDSWDIAVNPIPERLTKELVVVEANLYYTYPPQKKEKKNG